MENSCAYWQLALGLAPWNHYRGKVQLLPLLVKNMPTLPEPHQDAWLQEVRTSEKRNVPKNQRFQKELLALQRGGSPKLRELAERGLLWSQNADALVDIFGTGFGATRAHALEYFKDKLVDF